MRINLTAFWTYFKARSGCFVFPVLILVFATACGNDLAEVEELVAKFDTQVETAYDVEILYSDSARVRVRITGPKMNSYIDRRESQQEFPDGVKVEFFSEDDLLEATLTAKYGVRFQNEGKITVRDSVVWQDVENKKLETQELHWEERRKKIYTNKFVVITQPDEIIYGHGFEADQDLSHARIRAIEGKIKLNDFQEELE